jgi:hypothetical protein
MTSLDLRLAEIARQHLRIETLETRKRDYLDFHDLSVWAVRTAFFAAYELGFQDGLKAKGGAE